MSKKNTLNIYEVLEALNNKINNNTTLIENNTKQLEDKTNQLKIQLEESKIYLLETIEQKVKSNLDFLTSEFKKEANENRKNINSKQERLVTDEFKKLKIDINNDLETLANNIMNSQIL
jgi:F0F1-type ATP synthase membrane subunit b/b'